MIIVASQLSVNSSVTYMLQPSANFAPPLFPMLMLSDNGIRCNFDKLSRKYHCCSEKPNGPSPFLENDEPSPKDF
jgi:hypothetical protein